MLSALLGGVNHHLVLTDADTGSVYARYPMGEGDRFSVEFIHSVNQSPVRDIYEVRDGTDLYVVETDYFAFGAGVQTELNPGETLTYGEDGSMRVTGIDIALPRLAYMVGTVSDHTLRIGGQTISLRALCGRNSNVVFSVS
ncbi:MAG: DUF1850 domain-containing protein [Oscillospiraceae bacterium]